MEEIFAELLVSLDKWMHGFFASWANDSLKGIYDNINGQIGLIGTTVSETPSNYSTWGSTAYNIIKTVSDDVILPIAALIITALMCQELINAILEKNAMHEMGSEFIFKWLMKACFSVVLLSMTSEICLGIFDLGGEIAIKATGSFNTLSSASFNGAQFEIRFPEYLTDGVNINSDNDLTLAERELCGYDDKNTDGVFNDGDKWVRNIGELLSIVIMATIFKYLLLAVYIMVQITLTARMIEIFMYLSVAPIPFATLTNREWGNIGTNYVRALAALALQAFLIIVCVGIYSIIVNGFTYTDDLVASMIQACICNIALIAGIRGSKNFAMSIMNAH